MDALAALAAMQAGDDQRQQEEDIPIAFDDEGAANESAENDEVVTEPEPEGGGEGDDSHNDAAANKKRHKAIPMFTCAACGQFFPMGQVIEEDGQMICKDCFVLAATGGGQAAPTHGSTSSHSARYAQGQPRSRKKFYLTLGGAGLIAAIVVLLVLLKGEVKPSDLPEPSAPIAFAGPTRDSQQQRVNRAREGVVRVLVAIALTVRETGLEFRRIPMGQGSGFFVHNDGLVVTNHHVVYIDPAKYTLIGQSFGVPLKYDEPADEWTAQVKQGEKIFTIVARPFIQVQLLDDSTLAATVVDLEKDRDLGLLKVTFKGAQECPPVLNLLALPPKEVGGSVFSIGTPMDAASPNTVAEGKVSGFTDYYKESSVRVIQSSAHTNPGSSGGPLVDSDGEVEGVTTYILRKSPTAPVVPPRPKPDDDDEPADPADPADPAEPGPKPVDPLDDFRNETGKTVFNFTMPAQEVAKFVSKRGVKGWPRVALAWSAMAEKRWADAVKLLKELTAHESFHSKDGDAWYALGDAMLREPNVDLMTVRDAFEGATLFYPNSNVDRQAASFYAVGYVLQKQGRHEDAVKRFNEALRLDSAHHAAQYARGLSLLHLQKREEAVASIREASRADGDAGRKAREAMAMLGER